MTTTLDRETTSAQQAVELPAESPLITIEGPAGSGKTHTLLARASRLASDLPDQRRVLLSAPNRDSLSALRSAFGEEPSSRCSFSLLGDVAFEMLASRSDSKADLLDDVRAFRVFERACAELLSLEWEEFLSNEIDPEISGLRTPERFIASAYRLIRKLRAAQIEPDAFAKLCERGTTAFYAEPPNLNNSALVAGVSANYRDSLRASREELARQREREIDLAKIVAGLYARYRDLLVAEGGFTHVDALSKAAKLLLESEADRQALRERYTYACIDDAQDLLGCDIAFLQALYGRELHGVAFAGEAGQATRTFAGARGEKTLSSASLRCVLREAPLRSQAIENVARRSVDTRFSGLPAADDVVLHRTNSVEEEAAFVAETAAALITRGTDPSRIALITRSIRGIGAYISALLDKNVPVDIGGDANLHDFSAFHDALALLWSVADPYRHDYLLRSLQTPWAALSDATIARLCGEPSDPQAALFEATKNESDNGRKRWDRRRDLRLGRNLLRGDCDADLPPEAKERLLTFRAARSRWETLERTLELPALVQVILGETMLAQEPGNARERFHADLLSRLVEETEIFHRREPLGSLRDFLDQRDALASIDEELLQVRRRNPHTMSLLSVEAAKGRAFDHVFLIDARASGFPRYYAPDAFVFYPSLGMTAKENVGLGARAARTAKFTYALHAFKTRERYIEEERRAFAYAATRARQGLWISASGRATRGNAAPEFLEELRAARLPGVRELLPIARR